MISFISNIISHIVGICIGLAGGAVVGIILSAIFKQINNKIITTLFAIVFAILGAGLGYSIQDKYFIDHSPEIISPTEQIEALDKNLKENWSNTNGGFTFAQIEKAQNDDDCPVIDDQIIDLKCHDFGTYITFSLNNNGTYYNIMFTKTSNGLILDGVMNTTATINRALVWWVPPIWGYDTNSFKWNFEYDKEPYFSEVRSWLGTFKYDNLVSLSRQNMKFVTTYADAADFESKATNLSLQNANILISDMATSHFIKFGDVELIGTSEEAFVKINSFYNYLYEQIKGYIYNSTELVDATGSMCVPIPEGEQSKYPIPTSKKSEYDDKDYYGVYRCNIAVNLTFVKGNSTIIVDNSGYIKEIEENDDTKDKIKVEPIKPQYSYSKVKLNFVDKGSSDLSNVNLLNTPVEIVFTADNTKDKTVLIDDKFKLQNGVNILLNKNTLWNYTIYSEALIFDDFMGSANIKNNKSYTLDFEYYYLDGYILTSVGLNPIGSIDLSSVDLANNVVKIVLKNDNNTYQFVFDDNSLLNKKQTALMELGDYEYTILSNQLVFASNTGTLTITSTDKIMLFNYTLGSTKLVSFDICLKENEVENAKVGLCCITDFRYDTLLKAFRKWFMSSAQKVMLTTVLYDDDGKMVETESSYVFIRGNNGEETTSNSNPIVYWTNLIKGQNYRLQLKMSDYDDPEFAYFSNILNFTYRDDCTYEIRITYTEQLGGN